MEVVDLSQPPVNCNAGKKAGVAYNGPAVAKYNKDHPDGATTDPLQLQCAHKCAANAECTYWAVNKARCGQPPTTGTPRQMPT